MIDWQLIDGLAAENVLYRPNRDDLRLEAAQCHQRFYDPGTADAAPAADGAAAKGAAAATAAANAADAADGVAAGVDDGVAAGVDDGVAAGQTAIT